jgi:RNA polymerase sigma-70 factor (ECF subfamily)
LSAEQTVGEAAIDIPEELRRRLPERDPEALEAFFEVYFDRVYGYLFRLVRNEHLAEDLTQDVFLHVQRALHSYDPDRPVRPWLFTIATNKLRDHWRSRRHQELATDGSLDRDEAEEVVDLAPRAEAILSEAELHGELRRAVDELPDSMRTTVLLRVFEGLSFAEIGEVVGRNEVAVRKRYSRALEALRGVLGPTWQAHTEGG